MKNLTKTFTVGDDQFPHIVRILGNKIMFEGWGVGLGSYDEFIVIETELSPEEIEVFLGKCFGSKIREGEPNPY